MIWTKNNWTSLEISSAPFRREPSTPKHPTVITSAWTWLQFRLKLHPECTLWLTIWSSSPFHPPDAIPLRLIPARRNITLDRIRLLIITLPVIHHTCVIQFPIVTLPCPNFILDIIPDLITDLMVQLPSSRAIPSAIHIIHHIRVMAVPVTPLMDLPSASLPTELQVTASGVRPVLLHRRSSSAFRQPTNISSSTSAAESSKNWRPDLRLLPLLPHRRKPSSVRNPVKCSCWIKKPDPHSKWTWHPNRRPWNRNQPKTKSSSKQLTVTSSSSMKKPAKSPSCPNRLQRVRFPRQNEEPQADFNSHSTTTWFHFPPLGGHRAANNNNQFSLVL